MATAPLPRNHQSTILQSKNIRVLLADDNRVNQFLGKRILQNLGITNVDLVSNGNEAFEASSSKQYDLLLTDVEMPGMNGYELANTIRSIEKGEQRLLIIALTANATDEDREKAVNSGIDDYLTKPYTPQDLQAVLLRHFKDDDVVELTQMDFTASPDVVKNPLAPVYELFHHNARDIRHFLSMVSQQIPLLTDQIRSALQNENWDVAFQCAHKLKSPVNLLASADIQQALEVFTEDMRHQRDLASAVSRYDLLLPSIESLLVMVNRELESAG